MASFLEARPTFLFTFFLTPASPLKTLSSALSRNRSGLGKGDKVPGAVQTRSRRPVSVSTKIPGGALVGRDGSSRGPRRRGQKPQLRSLHLTPAPGSVPEGAPGLGFCEGVHATRWAQPEVKPRHPNGRRPGSRTRAWEAPSSISAVQTWGASRERGAGRAPSGPPPAGRPPARPLPPAQHVRVAFVVCWLGRFPACLQHPGICRQILSPSLLVTLGPTAHFALSNSAPGSDLWPLSERNLFCVSGFYSMLIILRDAVN